ncbi:hypothetical protein IEQ34_013509 [Dendrobium chrysotoxum]|uniref:ABC transporter domain-containing protein n=1 Tax=Dendrobium chrysotoxum TaxID=161865 RepID=A0AAV7GRV2_DENCH|nr:hypothetical protein IEQ34_013509 [Dendrobium chrysotoxum]
MEKVSSRSSSRGSSRSSFNHAEEGILLESLPNYTRLGSAIDKFAAVDNGAVGDRTLANAERRDFSHEVFEVEELRNSSEKIGLQLPTVEVRFEHLTVETECHIGRRALPTLVNATQNMIESILDVIGIRLTKRTQLPILNDVSGVIKPSRLTLLLGPPSSGKTTLLKTLAGRLDPTLKVLGLDDCADTIVGDVMRRGISGGQKKRLTTGEIIVGPMKVYFMDEILVGLDSSTAYQIVKYLQQFIHLVEATILMSLLQPNFEIFSLFDDIIIINEGHILYHGPREFVLPFFNSCGFQCPERKSISDFIQEVISRNDQKQYWASYGVPYSYVSAQEFSNHFNNFYIGLNIKHELAIPFDKSRSHYASLMFKKRTVPYFELLSASFAKEWLLIKHNLPLHIIKFIQILILAFIASTMFMTTRMQTNTISDGNMYIGSLAFAIVVNVFSGFSQLIFTVNRLPVFYKHRDLLLYPAWVFTLPNFLLRIPISMLESIVWVTTTYYIIGFAPEVSRFFKQFLILFLMQQAASGLFRLITAICRSMIISNTGGSLSVIIMCILGGFILPKVSGLSPKKGMVLPFTPLIISFHEVNYYIDMPKEFNNHGVNKDRLQLLAGVTGAFRPKILTALMGISGAGKTTLLDVLAGRKTSGYIEGEIRISGYSKIQETFTRILGYCEQNDIHSPQITVRESLIYSSFLRLPKELNDDEKMEFVDEVMSLMELNNLKDAIVGLPDVTGLSTEQRKRLTIAVELVANPSIIFMDEPTSGLDARAAAIVMRTVRNTIETGRTVVCTVHQPSTEIFEAFDELLLLKRGGHVIFYGPLGQKASHMIDYFEAILGVPKIKDYYNPATWMLEVSSVVAEINLDIDLADYYKASTLYEEDANHIRTIVGSMYVAVMFIGITNCSTVQSVLAIERTVFYRERAAGIYSTFPYALAQVIIEIPYVFAQASIYIIIIYPMMGFEWSIEKFMWFYYIIFFSFLYFTYYGMMSISFSKNQHIASIFTTSFYPIFQLFSGFFIPKSVSFYYLKTNSNLFNDYKCDQFCVMIDPK